MTNRPYDDLVEAFPSTAADLRREPRQEATADVPEELKWLSSDKPAGVKSVTRIARRRDPHRTTTTAYGDRASAVSGLRPRWVSASFRPQRSRLSPAPRVRHRGHELNPLVIWEPESRSTYNDTSYPWGCVCKITTASGLTGSGVLIGPRHVLTASHCVEWSTDKAELIEVHRVGTSSSAAVFATHAISFTQITDVDYTTVDEDYAVLIVSERLGDRFGYMGAKQYDSGWDDDHFWWTIGYPGDIAGGIVPIFQKDISLDEDEFDYGSARAMTTSADVMKGQSGAPMFGFWDGVPYVVAVTSAEGVIFASGTENWCSGGADLNRIIRISRENHP